MSDKTQGHNNVTKHSGVEYPANSWARWYHDAYVSMDVLETPPATIIQPPTINNPPIAGDDAATTTEGVPVSISALGMLLNDTDLDGDALYISGADTTSAQGGTIAINANSTEFIYTPPSGFIGTDSFNYIVNDGQGGTDTGTVSIVVNSIDAGVELGNYRVDLSVVETDTGDMSFTVVVEANPGDAVVDPPVANTPPVAVDDTYTAVEGQSIVTGNVLLNDTDLDGDTLVISGVDTTSVQGGAIADFEDGSFSYTPPPGFIGTDSFNYTVSDGQGGTDTGTVSIVVSAPPFVPAPGDWAQNSIQRDPANPRFLKFNDAPIYLLGASDDDQMHNWTVAGRNTHIALMESLGGNYIKNVLNTSVTNITQNEGIEADGFTLQPFRRITPTRYDLTQFNQVYFDRLAAFLGYCESRSIIVSVVLWELWDFVELGTQKYHTNAWNPANNINYNAAQSGLPNTNTTVFPYQDDWAPLIRFGFTVPALDNRTRVLDLQNAFIDKVMETCLPFTNVLYNIQNERMDTAAPIEWSDYWIAYIKAIATADGKQIQVGDQYDKWNFADHIPEIDRASLGYYDVAQLGNTGAQNHYDAVISAGNRLSSNNDTKPMIADKIYSDYYGGSNIGPNEPVDKMFKFIFAGFAGGRLHRPTTFDRGGDYETHGLGLGFEFGGQLIGQMVLKAASMLIDEVDIYSMTPDQNMMVGEVANEAYGLRNGNSEVAIYFTGRANRAVALDLGVLAAGNYALQRMEIITGANPGVWSTDAGSIAGGSGSLTVLGAANAQTLVVIKSTGGSVANTPPVAVDDTYTAVEGQSIVTGNVLLNDTDLDGDTLVISGVDTTSVQGGAIADFEDGSFSYTPPPGFIGTDSFNYTVSDGQGGTDTGIVSIVVSAPSNLPTPLARYNFDEGGGSLLVNSEPTTGAVYNLSLNTTIAGAMASWDSIQGLSFAGGAFAESITASQALIAAIKASGNFSFEAWVIPENITQSGPARIIELHSNTPLGTNVIFGPEIGTYTVRIRRDAGDTFGTNNIVSSPEGAVNTALTHIVFRQRASGVSRLYINGVPGPFTSIPVDFASWLDSAELKLGNNAQGDRGFAGEYKKIAFYDRYLTNAEIADLFAAGEAG